MTFGYKLIHARVGVWLRAHPDLRMVWELLGFALLTTSLREPLRS